VGRYVLEAQIGEGGMGVVYRAFDPERGCSVALKLARAQGGSIDATIWARLRREAQALARIRDPGVVGLFEAGQGPHGAYLALELVHGQHLRRWLVARRRPVAQIVAVLVRAAQALGAVHDAGLLHRDLKPTNILVEADDRVVLVDFGLALGFAEANDAGAIAEDTCRTRMTRRDMVVGTTHYMSPEQLMGRELDVRSDVFALAVTGYEALFGPRPFPAATAYDLAIAYDAAVLPSPPVGRVPRWVADALRGALALDPHARTPTADAFAAALRGPKLVGLRATAAVRCGMGGAHGPGDAEPAESTATT